MHLERLNIHSIAGYSKDNLRTRSLRHRRGEVVPHQSRMTTGSRLCNLNLPQHSVSAELLCTAQNQPEPQLHIEQRYRLTTNKIQTEYRKRLKPPRYRYTLITQLSKPMISRYEQVIPTDTVPIPIRRSMSSNPISIPSPPVLLL